MERSEVYKAVDSERDYQVSLWSMTETKGLHSVTEFIAYVEDYLAEAKHIVAREKKILAYPKALPIIRKCAAMLVSCMEQHGVEKRAIPFLSGLTIGLPATTTFTGSVLTELLDTHSVPEVDGDLWAV